MSLPVKVFTEKDVVSARHRGQLVGWLQGGAVVIAGAIVLNVLGWIPAVLTVGAVGYGAYKAYRWLSKSPRGKPAMPPDRSADAS